MRDFISLQRRDIDALTLHSGCMTKEMKRNLLLDKEDLTKYEKQLVELSSTKKRILDLISQIPGVEGEVLKRRYVDGEIWEDICENTSYSWQGVFKIHKRALRMVQDLLDQSDHFDT